MIDGKVLTAVLASIAAIAAAINGGGLTAEQVKSNSMSAPGDSSFADLKGSVADILPGNLAPDFLKPPKPDFSVSASLVVDDLGQKTLEVRNAKVVSANISRVSFNGRSMQSRSPIVVHGFTGRFSPGENSSRIKGRASSFVSEGVNVSGGFPVDEDLSSDKIVLEGVERVSLEFKDVNGFIEANQTETEFDSTGFRVNSFSGDMVFYSNSTVRLRGEVDKVNAGSLSLG